MKRTLSDFASNTSAHGWGNVTQRTTKLGRTLWFGLCLGCTAVAIWQVITIILRYGKFDTRDRIIVKNGDIIFPSVTVCPLLGLSATGFQHLIQDSIDDEQKTMPLVELADILQNFPTYLDNNVSQSAQSEKREFYEEFLTQLYSFQGYFDNGKNLIRNYSHKQEDFIPVCVYQGKSCLKTDVSTLEHHEHYTCFTFNGGNTTIAKPSTKISGPKGGLSLTLYLDTTKASLIYNPNYPTSGSQGVRVVIHEKGTLPDPENDGFDIEEGHSVNAALSVNERQLMKAPWGECADHDSESYGAFKYTKKHCLLKCLQRTIYETCDCVKSSLPVDNDMAHTEYCLKLHTNEWLKLKSNEYNLTVIQNDLRRLRCQNDFSLSDFVGQDGCQCREKCMYQSYEMTLSQSVWPSEGVVIDFYCRSIMNMDNYINSSIYKTYHGVFHEYCGYVKSEKENEILKDTHGNQLRKNVVRLNVFFKDLDTKITQQAEDFTISSMISEIGGSFGFFIGMSILTITEVILLCWNIAQVIRKKMVISPSHHKDVAQKHASDDRPKK
ncbi:unnamed protein product [Owenia fusiformis]|uniref:Uncharacterized protein n=1 Tax=Owenia fusiformis TaxID=6347 RepID=A0A8J1UYT7_OWEFU|nr:unnamed protein product [Owenia fusiformis]